MATSTFLRLATGADAIVLTDTEYASLGAVSSGLGFQAGVLLPEQFNKIIRQSSAVSAMIGKFIVDYAAADANDSQSTTVIEANFLAALNVVISNAIGGSGSAYLPITGGTMTGVLTLDGDPTNDLDAATKKYVDDAIAAIPPTDLSAVYAAIAAATPVSTVAYFDVSSAPTGWLKANGAAVSRTTYSALFAKIGTLHGVGDGSTTFNLPDLRGEFLRGYDDGRGADTGRVFGSQQSADVGNHIHSFSVYESTSGSGDINKVNGTNASTLQGTVTTSSAGGSETRPRNVALLPCIKY